MHVLHEMRIKADRKTVLDTLQANRAKHAEIVQEARQGYMKAAKQALSRRLAEFENPGSKLISLTFHLQPPQDHTKVYDQAIAMLELHTEDTIVLNSEQVRNLMRDEWNWKKVWATTNAAYSKMSREIAEEFDDD